MRERTTRHTSRLLAVVGLAAATLGVTPQPATAADITVTTTSVTIADDGFCSLPEAITASNTNTASGTSAGECPAGNTIFLPTGTIQVGPGGLPPITTGVTIIGAGAGTVIDGTNAGTNPGLTVLSGFLTLALTTIRGFAGGGIAATDSVLTVDASWIDDNGSSQSPTGGISFHNTTPQFLIVDRTTISNNATSGNGGGISISGPVSGFIINSTIANNTAFNEAFDVGGGGVHFAGIPGRTFTINASTIVGNDAPTGAGILRAGNANLTVSNSIVADNTGSDVDSVVGAAVYTSGGGNVIGDGPNTTNFTATGDITGQPAGVAPLADNGGPTPTMALQPGSPAIDRVTTLINTQDQREINRPQGPRADSGAYELLRPELTTLPEPCQSYYSAFTPLVQGAAPRTIQITGNCGIPTNATAVVFTVIAVQPQAPGNLRLSAAGVTPNGGVVNFINNTFFNTNTNTVTIELSAGGAVDLSANGGTAPNGTPLTDVFLEAVGYYSPGFGLEYVPVTPCAVADSRPSEGATGDFAGPFRFSDLMPAIDLVGTFDAAQGGGNTDCGVPATADTVVVNLVAVNATGPGYLFVPGLAVVAFEIGLNDSAVAYLNLNGGETAQITTDTNENTHIRVVVLGYLDNVGTAYTPVTPCAAFDTRTGEGATGAFAGLRAGDNVTTYQITGTIPTAQGGNGGNCGVPAGASAVLINLVAVNSIRAGNLQAYATGSVPTGGILNFAALTPPMNNSNAVPVPISALGQMDIRTNAGPSGIGQPTTHIRGIILGYYTS